MPRIANNADDYASARLNIFFPGVTPGLNGQCVSLVKGFLQDMTDVPDPQAARGDARYVGQTLVSQGHAVEVAYADRQRGDIVCYEYGTYGHIGVILSGNRTFEENVRWLGVNSEVVDGATVYASRIGSMGEVWRHDMHIYRINTYKEDDMATNEELQNQVNGLVAELDGERKGYQELLTKSDGLSTELDAERKGYNEMVASKDAQIAALKAQLGQTISVPAPAPAPVPNPSPTPDPVPGIPAQSRRSKLSNWLKTFFGLK